MVSPLTPPPTLMRKEIAAMLLVTVVTGLLFMDLYLGWFDSIVLLIIAVFFIRKLMLPKVKSEPSQVLDDLQIDPVSNLKASFYLLLGLGLLVVSSQALVLAASSIAMTLGVSTGVIGLTVVALGTSLPEWRPARSRRGRTASANILGSNIMNLLCAALSRLPCARPIERDFSSRLHAVLSMFGASLFCLQASGGTESRLVD